MSRRLALGACAALWFGGCTNTGGRYEDFGDRTADLRTGAADAGSGAAERVDFSGNYLMAMSTVLSPDKPLLFAAEAEVEPDLSTVTLHLQPLATDAAPEPRARVGDPITIDAPYGEDGSFTPDLGEIAVPGSANPISGSDIAAQVQLRAIARTDGNGGYLLCGDATGMVTMPLQLDLAGSTLTAVPTDDVTTAEPLLSCPDPEDAQDSGG